MYYEEICLIWFPKSTAFYQINFAEEEWDPDTKTKSFLPLYLSTIANDMPNTMPKPRSGEAALLVIVQAVKSVQLS